MYHLQIRLFGFAASLKLLRLLCLTLLPCPLQQHSPWRDQPARAAGKMHKTWDDFTASESSWKVLKGSDLISTVWNHRFPSQFPFPLPRSPRVQSRMQLSTVSGTRTKMQLPATGTVYQWVEECGSYWKFVKTSLGVPPQHFELPASSAKGKNMQKNIVWKQKIQGHCSSEKLPEHLDCCRFTFKGLVNPCPQTYQFCLWQMQKKTYCPAISHT